MRNTVATGLDRLHQGHGPLLRGVRVCILCHPASVNFCLQHIVPIVAEKGASVASLLGPEHGVDASAQDMEIVAEPAILESARSQKKSSEESRSINQTLSNSRVKNFPDLEVHPVYNLYGETVESLCPEPEMFHDAEYLICDLQDIGTRYYTYIWTTVLAAEAALKAGIRVLVLDRPNPLGGLEQWVEGGGVDLGQESFVGLHSVAVRHGMTMGELLMMVLAERSMVNLDHLEVLPCLGWERSMLFPDTGLPWVLPSPNMPTWQTSMVYPGQCLLEGTNISEGRGTTRPFEMFGAPWINGEELVAAIPEDDHPGIVFRPIRFKPKFQKWANQSCGGLQLHLRKEEKIRSLRTSWSLLKTMYHQGRGQFQWRTDPYEFVSDRPAIDLLAGGTWLREGIECGISIGEILASQEHERLAFIRRRKPFLLY